MIVYDSAFKYISCAKTLKERIVKIDQIIDALYETALKAAGKDNFIEYSINDGQVQYKTVYKGADAVLKSIQVFEALKKKYQTELNPRIVKLVHDKNFMTKRNGR
jgi:arginine deiminase